MSTKIYRGMCTNKSLSQIVKDLGKIREQCRIVAQEIVAKKTMELFCKVYDDHVINQKPFLPSAKTLSQAIMDFIEKEHTNTEKTGMRNLEYDMQLHIAIYALEENLVLLNPIFEQCGYYNIIKPYFNDFAYWDNTDHDPSIHEDLWNYRGECWYRTGGVEVLTWKAFDYWFNIVKNYSVDDNKFFNNQCISFIPSSENRVKTFVLDELVKIFPYMGKPDQYMKMAIYYRDLQNTHSQEFNVLQKKFIALLPEINLDIFSKTPAQKLEND